MTSMGTRSTVSHGQGLVESRNTTQLCSAKSGMIIRAEKPRTCGSPGHIMRKKDMHMYLTEALSSAVNGKGVEGQD